MDEIILHALCRRVSEGKMTIGEVPSVYREALSLLIKESSES